MEKAGWLVDGTDYIEFGAGRARLSSYLLECIGSQSKSNVLLIDRDTTRNKVLRLCCNIIKYRLCYITQAMSWYRGYAMLIRIELF